MRWSKNEEGYLVENYSTRMPLEEISEKLGRTIRSIQRKAQEMGISRPRKKFSVKKLRIRQKKANDKFYELNSKMIYIKKNEKRKMMKLELIKVRGGGCEKCGYDRCVAALEFHHKGKDKDGDLAHMIKNGSRQKALKEVEKCVLLCANCHREVHHMGF
jgi:predicted HNH restriction endonuclease